MAWYKVLFSAFAWKYRGKLIPWSRVLLEKLIATQLKGKVIPVLL
jgi:hypothetical protein